MNIRLFFSIVAVITAGNLFAQTPYVFDAERWARLKTFGGTARFMAMGGAGVALGADLGSAQVNPAGLGLCRKSQFAFSPDFGNNSTNAAYLDNGGSDSKASFGFDNIGVVFCSNKSDATTDEWKGGSFAVNITRMNTFHNRMSINGVNENNSMVDGIAYNNGATSSFDDYGNPLDISTMAYQAYLTDISGNNLYNLSINDDVVFQEDYVTTKGRIWQMDFAYGANYKDRLYLGAALGLTSLKYVYERTYTETVGQIFNNAFLPTVDTVDYFTFSDYLKTTGSGINVKAGLIAKPNDVVRIGLSLQSPTFYYSMKDSYNSSLAAQFDNSTVIGAQLLTYYEDTTAEQEFRYAYTAPARVSVGMSLFAGKKGFISGELEYVPYNMASFTTYDKNSRGYFNETNSNIRSLYQATFNYKVGGELRLANFKLRGGMNVISDPFKVDKEYKQHLYQFCGGFGFKLDNMTIDLAVVHGRNNSVYAPYQVASGTPEATVKNRQTNFVITTGFFFE